MATGSITTAVHGTPGRSGRSTRADGAALTTAQGGAITVDVLAPTWPVIHLQDLDPNDVDPCTIPELLTINTGNKGVAHGISFVLRPADL